MRKTINPGTMLEYVGGFKKPVQVFVKINYEPSQDEQKELQSYRHAFIKNYEGTGRLSMSGVVGPRANGDCYGSCGQIADSIREAINAGEFTPNSAQGWTVPDVLSFLDLWDRYHLNDMRPECDHQRAAGWPEMARQELKSYMWRLNSDTSSEKKRLEAEAIDRAASLPAGRSTGFNPLQRKILKLEEFITTQDETIGELARFYVPTKNSTGGDYFAHVKTKKRGWINHSEDPRGLLGKPCEVCGYKYGTAWNTEKLSKNILHTLEALAESKNVPAWI